jgi:hypothetical protein
VDAAQGRHARRQESHMSIVAYLVCSCALPDVVRVVWAAEMAFCLPIVTGAFEIVTNSDVHQKIGLL